MKPKESITPSAHSGSATAHERIRVVSLLPDVSSNESVISDIDQMVKKGRGGYVCVATVHMVMEAHDSEGYCELVNAADIIVTDGMPLVWMQKLQGVKEAQRVRGNDLMINLFGHAEKNGRSVGFYGGKRDVIEAIVKKAGDEYPGLEIVYTHSPPYRKLTEEEDHAVIKDLGRNKPDILFVGLGCPKQEKWMSAHKDEVASIMIGVGAAFDFYAGNIPQAPQWLQTIGLEWLYRLVQEPSRLWRRYLVLNPRFLALAIAQLLGLRKRQASKRE